VVSAYGLAQRLARNGRGFRRHLAELEKSQWYSEAEFLELQREKLSRLVKHAYDRVPYYRTVMKERGLTPDDIRDPSDLQKLPFLTKEIVRTRYAELVSEDADRRRPRRSASSGTTGTPLVTLRDQNSIEFEQASLWRHWGIGGLPLFGRRASLRGHPVVPPNQTTPPFWRRNLAENQLVMSGFHLSFDAGPSFAAAIQDFGARAVEALPASAYFLAESMLAHGVRLDLDLVLTGSEPIYPMHREVMERAFGCKVFDFYGISERVAFGMECDRHTGLHMAPEYGIVEFVDPRFQHEEGIREVVGTGLNNYAMPLIRYRTEDFTRPVDLECPCGRKMPLVAPFETRVTGMLVTPNGRVMAYALVNYAFMGLENIRKSQIVQESPEDVVVRIVAGGEFSDTDRRSVIERLEQLMGEGTHVDVELVDDIPREPSGKYRWIVSKVNPIDAEPDGTGTGSTGTGAIRTGTAGTDVNGRGNAGGGRSRDE